MLIAQSNISWAWWCLREEPENIRNHIFFLGLPDFEFSVAEQMETDLSQRNLTLPQLPPNAEDSSIKKTGMSYQTEN